MTETISARSLREDLQRVLDELDAADRAADDLATQLSDEQFHWQPDEGRAWSIAQCLEHLAITNAIYGEALRKGVDEARARGLRGRGTIAPTFFGRRFIGSLEPPVTRRFRSPGAVRPRSSGHRDEILRAFHSAHDRIRDTVNACGDVDINRATFRNPFFSLLRIRVGTGLRIIPAHDRRHLWQAEQVRLNPGFPR